MHLIGAEDVTAAGYPYDPVARAWAATVQRQRTQHKARTPVQRKAGTRARVLLGEGEGSLSNSVQRFWFRFRTISQFYFG